MTYTENYELNQWQKSDRIMMEDFNSDNAKIDAALAGLTKLAFGTYTGNDAATRVITLPFTPKVVWLAHERGQTFYYSGTTHEYWGGLILAGAPIKDSNDNTVAAVVTNGFEVRFGSDLTEYYKQYWYTNRSDNTYRYFALG